MVRAPASDYSAEHKLRAAIEDLGTLKARDFRVIAALHDWRQAAPRFDAALRQLVERWYTAE